MLEFTYNFDLTFPYFTFSRVTKKLFKLFIQNFIFGYNLVKHLNLKFLTLIFHVFLLLFYLDLFLISRSDFKKIVQTLTSKPLTSNLKYEKVILRISKIYQNY